MTVDFPNAAPAEPEPAPVRHVAWALAAAGVALPFVSELPIDVDRLAPLLLAPAVWLARKIPPADLPRHPAARTDLTLLLIVAVVALASALASIHPIPAFVQTATLAWVVAGAIVARRLSHHRNATRLVLGGIALGAALGCLAVWISWKEGTPISAFPYYGHGRLFGLHQMIGTMAGLAWLSYTKKKTVERSSVLLIAIVTCGGMLWSGGRAPLIGFACGAAASVWTAGSGRRKEMLLHVAMIFGGGILLSFVRWSPEPYLGWWGAVARSTAATSVDELTSTRLSFWQAAWREFLTAPWLGHGADAYRFIQPKLDGSQPHNWPLQLLLDFGVVGGVALGALLLRQSWRGLRRARPVEAEATPALVAGGAEAALVACLAAGLLDGVFYHAVLLTPAALFAGLANGAVGGAQTAKSVGSSAWKRLAATGALVAATALLTVHACVVGTFLIGVPPADPAAPAARLLRAFPSATFGLTRWLNQWRNSQPENALAWSKWAQAHSDNPAELHVFAAVMYANRGDFSAASAEVEAALQKCHVRSRPKLLELRKAIADARAQVGAAAPATIP